MSEVLAAKPQNIIEVTDLYKRFGEVRAVDGISFCVERGSFFAFLGLNGAGKSTTINILCSVLQKDSGAVRVAGEDLDKGGDKIKGALGIVFQNSVLDDQLTVQENLAIRASFYGLRGADFKARLAELTERLSLADILKRPFGKLSGGQRRRADIARGLINYPQILILDEPTTGLDPQTRKDVWQILADLRKERGMTVFFSTHYMEEANRADRVVILDSGKIAAGGTPAELKTRYSGDYIMLYIPQNSDLNILLTSQNRKYAYESGAYRIKVNNSIEAREFLVTNQHFATDFEVIKGDMDDVFLSVTGKALVGGAQ